MCIYVYITLEQECDLFDLQWNVHRIRALLLELRTDVPDPTVAFRDAHGLKIENLTTHSLTKTCLSP